MKCGSTVEVDRVGVGTAFDQALSEACVAVVGRGVERCSAIIVLVVRVGLGAEKSADCTVPCTKYGTQLKADHATA